ncbi:mechanosensitive ion channel [Mariprofundus sp. KV]|uniref:mechanosensitive ion channel family protein n=1 Tax=Mariprofundus sp. KV TaxID=2608715 RepID=UPI00159F7110|nr:mechanosensitive ion channel [Mariprofundus sp. KV]NWF35939.1 mechanosensitive ion channel [Mariprofundus sp. KV]
MENLETVAQMVLDPMQMLWGKITSMMPNIFAALLMLVAGYLLARVVGFMARKFAEKLGVDSLADRLNIHHSLNNMNVKKPVSELFGMLVFLFIVVAFLLSAVETLGFDRVSSSIDQLLLYLPKVLGAAMVLMVGLFIADFVRTGVRNAAEGVGLEYAPALSKVTFGLIVVVVVMLAVDQLEIELFLLNELIGIILVSVGVAVALSLGLGSRDLSRQIVSGVYVRDIYRSGETIEFAGFTGKLIEVGTVKSVMQLENGSQVSFSNEELLHQTVVIHPEK